MKRFRLLALLLLALAAITPWTGFAKAAAGECPAYPSCSADNPCPDGEDCIIPAGHSCGTCS